MKMGYLQCLVITAVMPMLAASLFAATPDAVETWSGGDAAGWMRYDPLNDASSQPALNASGFIEVKFGALSMPSPEVVLLRADAAASGAAFVENYWREAITNISFQLRSDILQPAGLRLYFCSADSGRWWYRTLALPPTNAWTSYDIPLLYGSGWRRGVGGVELEFIEDLRNVAWVGIRVERNSSILEHSVAIDDFKVNGASAMLDSDRDGMSDKAEFSVGTSASDAGSVFQLKTLDLPASGGAVVRWPSATARRYTLLRAARLDAAFVPIAVGIEATPPENMYEDRGATGVGPYFYKLRLEEP